MRTVVVVNFNRVLQKNSADALVDACQRWKCGLVELTETNFPAASVDPKSMKTQVFASHGLPAAAFLADLISAPPGAKTMIPDEAFIVDADTIISAQCPNPFETFAPDHFVAVQNGNKQRFGDYAEIVGGEQHEWKKIAKALYGTSNPLPKHLEHGAAAYFNSGVMLARRAEHGPMFNAAYQICLMNLGLGWSDQTPLNFAARQTWTKMQLVDETWNFIHPHTLGRNWADMAATGKFIYHFAGEPDRNEKIAKVKWKAAS